MDERALIQAELDRDEALLWFGTPLPQRVAQQEKTTGVAAIFGVAFIVFWMCVVVFIGWSASQAGAPAIFPLFMGGMLLFGFFMLVYVLNLAKTPARAAAKARDTIYAVTDKRLIVVVAGQGARSYAPRDIERLERRDTPDGRGDVIFARERRQSVNDHDGHYTTTEWWKDLGFFGIENPREVERLIRVHLLH